MSVITAASSVTAASLKADGSEAETIDLGVPRPPRRSSPSSKFARQRMNARELELFRDTIRATEADYAVHMFSDQVLPQLALEPGFPAKISVFLFRPRAHYPAMYASRLGLRGRIAGTGYEYALRRWRRRTDAHAVLTLDEGAALGWAARSGAQAVWLPEPPITADYQKRADRSGAIVFGGLGPRKGLERVAAAARLDAAPLKLTLAGNIVQGYEDRLRSICECIRAHGAEVDVRSTWHTPGEALTLLAGHRCALLPYVGHYGMSRVLLEAAHAGTPVVVHGHGLIGHLVNKYGVGLCVDTNNPVEFREAIDVLNYDDGMWAECHGRTSAFAEMYGERTFSAQLDVAFPRSLQS